MIYILISWFTCGAIAARMAYLYFYHEYPMHRNESNVALYIVALFFGIGSLIASFICFGTKHGIFFHPKQAER